MQERNDGDRAENVRNVMHMLAPLLVAHAGRGPRAVQVPHTVPATDQPVLLGRTDDRSGQHEFTMCEPCRKVSQFLAAHVDHVAGEHTHLKYGLFQIGKLILVSIYQEYFDQERARMPKDLAASVLRIDAGVPLPLPPACHLYLAELCLEKGFETMPSASSKTREVRSKRGRGAEIARAQAQRAGLAEQRARKEAEALLVRAEDHLACFVEELRLAGGTLAAARGSVDAARGWVARFHWATHRLRWQHGNAAAAHEHIELCARAVLGMELLAPASPPLPLAALDAAPPPLSLALPHCPTAPLINTLSLKRAGRRLQLHKVLEDLSDAIARRSYRAVFATLAPDLLPSNAREAVRLFATPKAYYAALQRVLAALDPAVVEPWTGSSTGSEVVVRGAADAANEGAGPARAQADLSEREILSLRMSCCLCFLQVALPLEPSINKHSKLVVDGHVSENIALVRTPGILPRFVSCVARLACTWPAFVDLASTSVSDVPGVFSRRIPVDGCACHTTPTATIHCVNAMSGFALIQHP